MKVNLVCKGKPIAELLGVSDALTKKGVAVELISPSFSLADLYSETFWRRFIACDLLYYRTGLGDAARPLFASKLAATKAMVVNQVVVSSLLHSNKVFQNIKARSLSIAVPETLIGRHNYASARAALGDRFVMKAANGVQGSKVHLIESEEQYLAHIGNTPGDILLQELIPNTGDYRVLVIGGQVHEIFKRVPLAGDFRANVSLGGTGEKVVDSALRDRLGTIAVAMAQEMRLDIAGIDIIQSDADGQLYFLEANVNPGWKGLDTATGAQTSQVVADWFINLLTGAASLPHQESDEK